MTDRIDMLALMLARADKEPSRALSQRAYGDPANFVKFEREHMDDKELNAYCQQWVQWCWTRKYFIPPGAKNILARMQPAKVGQVPDAAMSDDMSFFNMALHALADMQEHEGDARCFVSYYCERASNIKSVAAKMGIGRQTYYDRMYRFARKALSMSSSLRRAHYQFTSTETESVD